MMFHHKDSGGAAGRERLGAMRTGGLVAAAGVGLVVIGFATCVFAIVVLGGLTLARGGTPNIAVLFGTFGVGFALAFVGGVVSVIGVVATGGEGAEHMHQGAGSGYETVTRPRRAEPVARHGSSVHELVDD